MAALEEEPKVKVQYHNDPKRFRFVTKQAASYLSPKWVLSEDQLTGAPTSQKKVGAAAPAESTVDRKAELAEKYNELTGEQAEPEWNEARLFVEITKATAKASEAAEEAKPEKRKYTKKAKAGA